MPKARVRSPLIVSAAGLSMVLNMYRTAVTGLLNAMLENNSAARSIVTVVFFITTAPYLRGGTKDPQPPPRRPLPSPRPSPRATIASPAAESTRYGEPDPPHGHLGGGWLVGSLDERHDGHQHRAARA